MAIFQSSSIYYSGSYKLGKEAYSSSIGFAWFDCGSEINSTSSFGFSYCEFVPGTPGTPGTPGGGVWSTGGALNTGRSTFGGSGTQNAALAFGGSPSLCCTEEYNGSTWTTVNPLSLRRRYVGGTGTQNAALAFGGNSVLVSIDNSFSTS